MPATVDPSEVEALFHLVADLSRQDATRILDAKCRRVGALRQAVERMLRYDRAAPPDFLLPDAALAAEVVGAATPCPEFEQRAPETLRAGEKVGRFTVREPLGAGAMAVVYLADDGALARQVALKVLQRGLAAAEWLEREARALARVAHPNVAQVYEVGEHDGLPFIAMELVLGTSLRSWLAEKPRSPTEILRTFAQAGRGLAAAHERGLVHRDFKPDNVLVGADGRVRVVDFGIAALMEPGGHLEEVRLCGTPAFMAPEQFQGERGSPASDQFSFSVAVYRALFGFAPFPGGDALTLRRNVLAGRQLPSPRSAGVPMGVHRILARGLARDPRERFPSMSELVDAVERHLPPRDLDPAMGQRERQLLAVTMCALGGVALALVWWARTRWHLLPTSMHFLILPGGALALHASAAVAFRKRLLGNRFARNFVLVAWVGILTVLMHRVVAFHFGQPLTQVLCVDLLVLSLEHALAAALFDLWFALSALVFLAGATVALLSPSFAVTAMLTSVVLAYALPLAQAHAR
jgi:predicted Ser/Thr protein kinase